MILAALMLGLAAIMLGAKYQTAGVTAFGIVAIFFGIAWAIRDEWYRQRLHRERLARQHRDGEEVAQDRKVFGACGLEGCLACRPLYDEDNNVIRGTELWGR